MISKRDMMLGGGLALMLPGAARAGDAIIIPIIKNDEVGVAIEGRINDSAPLLFELSLYYGFSWTTVSVAMKTGMKLIDDALVPFSATVGGVAVKAYRVNAAHATFGNLRRSNMLFLRLMTKSIRKAIDGIIGSHFFLEQPCILDIMQSQIRVFPDKQLPSQDFTAITTKFDMDWKTHRAITVEASIGGESFLMPLGMDTPEDVVLTSAFVKHNNLWDRLTEAETKIEDDSDAKVVRIGNLENFAIGPFHFDKVRAKLDDPANAGDGKGTCWIGLGLLSQFEMAIDRQSGIFLKPNTSFTGKKV